MGADFEQMYQSGLDLWRGQYTGLYPLPINGLFALLALLPYPVALALISFVGLALFVATLRRQALLWIAFQPILAGLWLGQLDLIWLWLLRWSSPVSLALMTLKPQLFPLAIPALLSHREMWRPFALACLGLYGPVTLIRPSWPLEWLRVANDGRLVWYGSTSVLGNPIVGFAALLAVAALVRLDGRAVFWSCNPTIRWYDFALMAGGSLPLGNPRGLWLIPASWMLFVATQVVGGNPGPVALLGLVDLALRHYEGSTHRRRNRSGDHPGVHGDQ